MRNTLGRFGFTLVEVAVATVIIALAVLGVTMIVTQTIRANLEDQRTIEATQIAETLIEQTLESLQAEDPLALTCPGITNGTQTGDSGTEYATILELTPLRLDLNTGQYSALSDCASTDLYQLDVTVAWEGGENVHLTTLTSSDPTYTPHPVFDEFMIDGREHEEQTNICAANLPGSVTLEWAIYGAATVTLQLNDAEPINVDPVYDVRTFDVSETTTFTLTATNAAGITVKEQRTAIVDAVPLVNAFTYNPNPTLEGVPSTLSWSTTDAQAVFLDDEPVPAAGARNVLPSDGQTATLRLVNGACETTKVIDTPLAVTELEILDFKPDRGTVTEGANVTLGWTYNHALNAAHHTATLTNNRDSTSLDVTTTTYQPVSVDGPTTYTLTITNKNGDVLAQSTASVDTIAAARIDAFDATPTNVCGPQPITATWAVVDASKLTLMPMRVDVTEQNSVTLPIEGTTDVYLAAENQLGDTVESRRVTITHTPTPIVTFTSDKTNITQGDTLTLTWQVTDAQTITINSQVVADTGSWTVAPLTTTTYTLAANNEGCEPIEREITITVQPLEITSATVTPAEVTSGEEATLAWTLNDAFDPNLHRFVVEPLGIDVGSDTSLTIPTDTAGQYAYTVIAYDKTGSLPPTPEAPDYTGSDRELARSQPASLTVIEKPVIDAFTVEPQYVCGPAPVTVTWQTRFAHSLTINAQALAPVAAGNAQVNITNATPPLHLEAKNRLGYATTAGPTNITYYEVPTGKLTSSEPTITAGQATTLNWASQHATSIKLDGQSVDATGSLEVTPLHTTTYVLELLNGPDCAPVRIEHTITVKQVQIDSFTSDHSDITRGESTTLRWSITNLDPTHHKVTLHPLDLDITNLTQQVVSPLPPRERYTLTVHEEGGEQRELATSDTVTVVVDEAPTVVSLQADPVAVCGVGETTLTWSTINATRVMLDNVDVPLSNPFGTTYEIDRERTFTLRAENRLAYPDAAQVTVHHAPQPVVSFTVDKTRIPEGDTITLNWSVVDADRVYLGGEEVPATGSRTLTPREASTYHLEAVADNALPEHACLTPAEVTVQVDPVSIKRFGLTTTTEVTRGDTITLPWEMEGPFTPSVHSLTLETIPTSSETQSVDVTSLTQLDVRPQVDTTYRLTLRGAVGQMLHQSSVQALVLDPPVITRFTATPPEVCEANSVTLAWQATGAASAYLNGEPLGTPGGGTTTRDITNTQTFELEVRNSLGASAYAYQTVTARNAPTASLTADKTSVPSGGAATITWAVEYADEVLLDGRRVEAHGSLTITPTTATTITIEARASGCATVTREVTIEPQPVSVTDLQASRMVVSGESWEDSTLTWALAGYHPELHQVILEPSGDELIGSTHEVTPQETTTYRVSVRSRADLEKTLSTSNAVTITVVPEPIIDALRVEPAYTCTPNQVLTVSWATRYAASVTLDGQAVPLNGSKQVAGEAFTLEASNARGQKTTQTIEPLTAPERVINFTASSEQVLRGESVTLTWDAAGVHAAKLDGQPTPHAGSLQVAPAATTTYRLQTTTSNGAIDCSTTHLVTVEVEELGIESLTATPTLIPAGGASTLTWQTTSELAPETHTLTLQPTGLDVTTLTERQVRPEAPTTYWLELRDQDGRLIERSERVTVAIEGKPALTTATVTPTKQCRAGDATITWSSVNAAHVLIDGIERPAAGSHTQTITSTRQFTLTPVDSLGNVGNTETLLARLTPEPTINLTTDNASISRGDKVTLTWNVTGADSVTLDGQHVPATGSRTIKPNATTTYRLEATTGDCVTAQARTVEVHGVHIDTFTADRPNITQGDGVTLAWTLTGFDEDHHTLTLHPSSQVLEHDAGTHSAQPTSDTQYLLRVTDPDGRVLSERRLEQPVRVHQPPTITSFTADQLLVHADADVTLRWGTRNAASVTLNGNEVTPKGVGATTRRITTQRAFTLEATNAAGTTVSANLTIEHATQPTANLQAAPARITAGDSTTLTWEATGQQVVINGAAVPPSGTLVVAPTHTSTYTLESRNPNGQTATSTVTVQVDPVRVTSLTADPTRGHSGDEITLAWELTPTYDPNLHTLTLKPQGLDVTDQTTHVIEADASTTYQLVLTDKSGRELHRTRPGVTITVGSGAITSLTATNPTCRAYQTHVTWTTREASNVRLNGQAIDSDLTRRGEHTLNPAPATITLQALDANGQVIDVRSLDLQPATSPTIKVFEANRSAALAGQSVTLEWNVTGAARVTIDGVEVPAQGEATLPINETTTYTLHAESDSGCGATQRESVEAHHVSVENLTSDQTFWGRTQVRPGAEVTLNWEYPVAPGAEHTIVLEGHGPLTGTPTSHVVTPEQTTTYSVAVLDQHGRVLTRSNTLTVETQPGLEVVTFDATPASVCGVGDVLLTWSTRNATRAHLDHREVTTEYGTTTVRAAPGTTYRLDAWATYGDASKELTIGGGPRPTINFDVTPARRVAGQEATITWDVTGATSVKLNGQNVEPTGSHTDTSHETVAYRLEVTSDGCDPIILERVIHTDSVEAYALTADRTHITEGDTTNLRWSLSDTFDPTKHKLILEPTGQDITGERTLAVSPTETTAYHLNVTNHAGEVLATSPNVTITVEGMAAITSFDATPTQVCGVQDVTFTWSTLNAARVLLNGAEVSPLSSGSSTIRVTQTSEYVLEAINPLGVRVASEPLTIQQADRPTITFTADKTSVVDGESVELTWSVNAATQVSLDEQAIATSGTLTVHPRTTTTYTIAANNPAAGIPCETTANVTITVQPVDIQDFTATPTDVTFGHDYQLAWSLTNTFDPELHAVHVDDSSDLGAAARLTRQADETRTHTLTLKRRHDNSVIATKTASVTVHAAPVIDELTLQPAAICAGGQSTLTWATRHAHTITLNGQNVPSTGTSSVNPNSSTTYELIATNPAGTSVQQQAALTVHQPPLITYTTSKANITAGDKATLTWDVQNATSARLNGQSVPLTGSLEVNPLTTTTYTLSVDQTTCGTNTRSITINVAPVGIDSLTAHPTVVTIPDTSEVRWTLTSTYDPNLHTLELNRFEPLRAIGVVTGTSHTVTPDTPGYNGYELSILDKNGRTLATRQVEITGSRAPVINNLTADPASVCVAPGAAGTPIPITLTWDRDGQWTTALINGQATTYSERTQGHAVRNATDTTTFTLEGRNRAYEHDSSRGSTTASVTVPFTQVIDPTLTATKTRITAGDTTTITWSADGTNVTLDGDNTSPSGSLAVRPTSTTTYTLTSTTADCAPITKTITITVDPVSVNTFSADKTNVTSGDPVQLTWSLSSTYASNLHELILEPLGTTLAGTNTTVHPTVTTTYRLRIDDHHGRTLARGPQVTVTANTAPAIESFTVEPQLVCGVNDVTLTWATANATSLKLNGQALTPISNGSTTRQVTGTTTFTLAALNAAGGSVTQTHTVTYVDPLQASLTSDKPHMVAGDTTTLTWSGAAAKNITLDGQPVNATGTQQVTPKETTTYTLVATSEHCGTITRETTIQVDPVTIDRFEMISTDLLDENGSLTGGDPYFAWETTNLNPNLHSLELKAPGGTITDLPASGDWYDSSPRTYTYVLTIYDQARNVLDQAEVTTIARPYIDWSAASQNVCVPATREIAWTVYDTQRYTIHQDGQLVLDVDRGPDVVTEVVRHTVDITDETPVTVTYTAINPLGSTYTRSITYQGHYPPELTLEATPAVAGAPVTLTWNVTNAPTGATITLDGQTVPASGETTYVIGTDSQQHTLRIENGPCGTSEKTIDLNPLWPGVPSFNADDTTVTTGDIVQFTWSTANYDPTHHRLELSAPGRDEPTSTDAHYDLGAATSHARAIPGVGPHDYRLKLYSRHSGEQLASSRTIRITSVHKPSVDSFTATPAQVCSDNPQVTLAWSTSNASYAYLNSAPFGSKYVSTNGSRVETLTEPTTFYLTAFNSANFGVMGAVHVDYVATPEVTSFTAEGPNENNGYVTAGKTYTLTWSLSEPTTTPILDGVPQAPGITSVTRLAPNSPDPITHTLTFAPGPCAAEPTSITVNPAVAPSAIPAPTATITGEQQVTLTWEQPAFNGNAPLSSTGTYRLENGGNPKTVYVDGNLTTLVDESVLPGNTYKYFVWHRNAAGLYAPYSPYSNEVTVIGVPGIPGAPVIQGLGDRSVTIAWTPPLNDGGAEITSYRIQRQIQTQNVFWVVWGDWETVANTGSADTTFTDTGLSAGSTYRYRVAATNQAGTGAWSNPSPEALVITTPGAPSKPIGERDGADTLTWSWTPPTDDGGAAITSYRVRIYRLTGADSWQHYKTISTSNLTYSSSDFEVGQEQRIEVAARNVAGYGAYSEMSDVLWAIGPPKAPTAPRITARGDQNLTVEWDQPNDGGAPITEYGITNHRLTNLARNATVTGPSIDKLEVVNDGANEVTSSSSAYSSVTSSTSPGTAGPEGNYFQIDLRSVRSVSGVNVYFYAHDARHYWYKVKVSEDGENWTYAAGTPSGTAGWRESVPSTGVQELHPTTIAFDEPMNVRYVQVHVNGNTRNGGNHVYEIEVWGDPNLEDAYWTTDSTTFTTPAPELINLASAATITGTDLVNGHVVNDGDNLTTAGPYAHLGSITAGPTGPESRYFELDLGSVQTVGAVRTYFYGYDVRHYWYKVKVSTDGVSWTYLAGNSADDGWVQSPTSQGQPATAAPAVANGWANARYVRVYVNGNSNNNGSHVYEIEVWGNPTSSKAPRLKAGEWHAFRVGAKNEVGNGPLSDHSVGTQVVTTPSVPQNLRVHPYDGMMEIWWNYPATNGYAPIENFHLEYRLNEGGMILNWQPLPYYDNSFSELWDTFPGDDYQFRVAAVNRAGMGPFATSPWVTAIKSPNNPSAPTATATGNRSAAISWSAVNGYGSSVTYDIQYQYSSNDGSTWSTWRAAANDLTSTSWTQTGRTAGYLYRYRLLARNDAGASGFSTASNSVLIISVPGAPSSISSSPGNGSIIVSWPAPDTGYSPITRYQVQYRYRTSSGTLSAWYHRAYTTSRSNNHTVAGSNQYQYRVRAENAAGWGSWTTSPWRRAYTYRRIYYRFEWHGGFCHYNMGTAHNSNIYGNGSWYAAPRITWQNGWGCNAYLDLYLRWDNQATTPTPYCDPFRSDQTLSGWYQHQCSF